MSTVYAVYVILLQFITYTLEHELPVISCSKIGLKGSCWILMDYIMSGRDQQDRPGPEWKTIAVKQPQSEILFQGTDCCWNRTPWEWGRARTRGWGCHPRRGVVWVHLKSLYFVFWSRKNHVKRWDLCVAKVIIEMCLTLWLCCDWTLKVCNQRPRRSEKSGQLGSLSIHLKRGGVRCGEM